MTRARVVMATQTQITPTTSKWLKPSLVGNTYKSNVVSDIRVVTAWMSFPRQYGQYDYSQPMGYASPGMMQPQQPYTGQIFQPTQTYTPSPSQSMYNSSFDDEPPLLEGMWTTDPLTTLFKLIGTLCKLWLKSTESNLLTETLPHSCMFSKFIASCHWALSSHCFSLLSSCFVKQDEIN